MIDFTYLVLVVPALILGFWAQMQVQGAYGRFSKVASRTGLTGRDAAQAILRASGVDNVQIVETQGHLTDHYDPAQRRLALSSENYHGTSLAALGVSAHEAGHALQHATGYGFLKLRMSLVGITGFSSNLLNILMMASLFGMFLGAGGLSVMMLKIVIGLMLVITVFQLVTLPVEFDASKRAKRELVDLGIIGRDELAGVCKTLDAAGWTYVAAFAVSLMEMVHYVLVLMQRNQEES